MCSIPTDAQIFFWSFLYTVEALQTDTLVSAQLYLWWPSQNFAFLNSHTNSVLLHSPSAASSSIVKDTFFVSWGCPLMTASTVHNPFYLLNNEI